MSAGLVGEKEVICIGNSVKNSKKSGGQDEDIIGAALSGGGKRICRGGRVGGKREMYCRQSGWNTNGN
jgi:hypothetical protein